MSAEADLAFHASIAEASGNDFYLGVLESIHDSISGFMRLTLSLTRTGSRQRAEPCWTSTPPYSRPSARRTASTRAWPCSSTWAGRGTGWWTASATERGIRIFTTQARHNKRRGPRADK